MKLAIVGSREFKDWPLAQSWIDAVFTVFPITSLVSGGASGADSFAEMYAKIDLIPIEVIKPEWEKGIHAGFERNSLIVEKADIVLAFWNGGSKGTIDTINKTVKAKKPLIIYTYPVDELALYNVPKSTKTL